MVKDELMKVCIISPYPPRKCGIGFFVEKFVDELKKRCVNVFVLTFKDDYSQKVYKNNILRILSNNPLTLLKSFILLRRIKVDIIHIHYAISGYGFFSIPMFIMLFIFRITSRSKFIIEFHELTRNTKILNHIFIPYYAVISRIFDKIYVHTKFSRDILINRCFINEEKIKIIQLIPYEFEVKNDFSISNFQKEFNFEDKEIILYFGFIHPYKGIEYLLEAAKLIKDWNLLSDDILIIIAGDIRPRYGCFKVFENSDRRYLKRLYHLRKILGLENYVKFIGYVDQKYVYPLFHSSKLIALPYLNIEQSGVLNLALAIPKPVITSNVGELGEILKTSGILVPPKDSESIALEIVKLFQNDLYYESVLNKYEKIKESYNINRIIDMIIEEYKSSLEIENINFE